MKVSAYLGNPFETLVFVAFVLVGIVWRPAMGGAAAYFALSEIIAGLRKSREPRWWPSLWPATERSLVVLYDAQCALCMRSKAHLESWKTSQAFRFIPLQSTEARSLVPDLPENEYMGAMHVLEAGKITSGGDAWLRIMELGPLGWAWLGWVAPRPLVRFVYAWIARHRYRWFGKVCEGGTCRVHPTPSGDRSSMSPSDSQGPSSAAP